MSQNDPLKISSSGRDNDKRFMHPSIKKNVLITKRFPYRNEECEDEENNKFVPSQFGNNNVRLITVDHHSNKTIDLNKYERTIDIDNNADAGILYYSEDSFCNAKIAPEYVLTVHSSIFRSVVREINDAHSVPCRMYFCCHGGDGAHSGVSHNDYVDIRVAWVLLIIIFGLVMLQISELPDGE